MLSLNELIYSQNSYHQIKSILLEKYPNLGTIHYLYTRAGWEKMEALEGVLDLLNLFWGGGGRVSVVKNRIATGFRIGRIVVIEVI
jgi:hypothetical protein